MASGAWWVLPGLSLALLAAGTLSGCDDEATTGPPQAPDNALFRCNPDAPISASPLRRLSLNQYRNASAALLQHYLGGDQASAVLEAYESAFNLIPHDAEGQHAQLDQVVTQAHIDAFHSIA